MTEAKTRVLFLCTHDACRGLMAEALARSLGRGKVESVSLSAGEAPQPAHPLAVRVMADIGIDIAGLHGRTLAELREQRFDFVIAVCDRQCEVCPTWPGSTPPICWSIGEPRGAKGTYAEQLRIFQRVRDQIRQRISLFLLANHVGQASRAGGS